MQASAGCGESRYPSALSLFLAFPCSLLSCFGRIDCYLDAVCLRVSYSSNAPNRLPPSVLPDPMDLHCCCIGLGRLPTTTLRRYNSNDGERIYRDLLPVTFHRAAQAPHDVVNAVLSALCRGIGRTKGIRCGYLGLQIYSRNRLFG